MIKNIIKNTKENQGKYDTEVKLNRKQNKKE